MRAVVRCAGGIPMQRYVIILNIKIKQQVFNKKCKILLESRLIVCFYMDFSLARKFLLPHDEKIFLWHGGAVFSSLCKKFSLPSLLFFAFLCFCVFVFL